VRKIGSAPTSPSDWDLVVTETAKDTYKVSWYVDQWLTNGETYYYRVFSYSDLGGISYCDAESVTISNQWQPWANTIAYYPLDSTNVLDDLSGNNRGLTKYWTVTFWTYAWVDCVYVNEWELSYQESDIVISSSPRTVSWWYYQYQVTSADNATIFGFGANDMGWWSWQIAYWNTRPWTPWIYIYQNNVYWPYTPFNNGEWYHLCYTYDGATAWTLYVNWVSVLTITTSDAPSSTIWVSRYKDLNRSINWYVSELIFEDKERSQSEVIAYFNATKWDYWIS
jgi:hypothetical protein